MAVTVSNIRLYPTKGVGASRVVAATITLDNSYANPGGYTVTAASLGFKIITGLIPTGLAVKSDNSAMIAPYAPYPAGTAASPDATVYCYRESGSKDATPQLKQVTNATDLSAFSFPCLVIGVI